MWRNPKIVPPKYQSDTMNIVTVLVAAPDLCPNPAPGYYLAPLKEWRIAGVTSAALLDIQAWHPLPDMPRQQDLFWKAKGLT